MIATLLAIWAVVKPVGILAFFLAAILQPSTKKRGTSRRHRYNHHHRQNTHRTPRAARSTVTTPEKVEAKLPAFMADVEGALINLQYTKKEAANAVKRASGDTFEARLKSALVALTK
jgi:hypothetical protein